MSDFPGVGPVVKIPHFYYRGCGFDPWSKKIHMLGPVAKKKKKKKGRRLPWIAGMGRRQKQKTTEESVREKAQKRGGEI